MSDDTRELIERLRTDAHDPGVAPATALQAAAALEASLPTEQTAEERLLHAIFEGESDRDALARIAKRVIDVEVKYDDDDWHRFADAALAEGFRRSPVPPETDEAMLARRERDWRMIISSVCREFGEDYLELGRYVLSEVERLGWEVVPSETEEPEWEYGTRHLGQERVYFESYARKRADELGEHLIRRRKAGPWVPVPEGDKR